jgi:hypothetical protein
MTPSQSRTYSKLAVSNNALAPLTFGPPKRIEIDIIDKTERHLPEHHRISSATRNIRVLSKIDVEILLEKSKRQKLA